MILFLDRFTTEEVAAISSLETLFGPEVLKYAIVLFTGGDELEEDETTLDDYLSANGAGAHQLNVSLSTSLAVDTLWKGPDFTVGFRGAGNNLFGEQNLALCFVDCHENYDPAA